MFKGRSPVGTIHCRFANSPAFMGSFVNENCCIVGGTEGGGAMYGRMSVSMYVSFVVWSSRRRWTSCIDFKIIIARLIVN